MKTHLATAFIALVTGYLGGVSSHFFQSRPTEDIRPEYGVSEDKPSHIRNGPGEVLSEIESLQQKINRLEIKVSEIASNQAVVAGDTETEAVSTAAELPRQPREVAPNKDLLVSAGVNPDVAEEILRRISQEEFQRLQLQNLIQRGTPLERRQYSGELAKLNQNKMSLRSELGDDVYDRYLVVSGQNNRVKVNSVMSGSPAELNGIRKDDVILYYDDQKIFNWSDLRKATLGGEIGGYANIVVLRDGMSTSMLVPTGTLGVKLEALQMDPSQ